MKRDKEVTKVIFKKAYDHYIKEWYVVAFLPGATASPGNVMYYEHCGQHGECVYDFYLSCKRASPEEYAPLKKEMENCFGYNFKVVRKITRKDCEVAWRRV